MKRGIGLIEVLAAAVVLAFLMIALNIAQKGNRESVLRIRARDAANVVAQDIIDSISAIGSASVPANTWACEEGDGIVQDSTLCRKRIFTGSSSMLLKDTSQIVVPYSAMVSVKQAEAIQIVNDSTEFMKALHNSGGTNNLKVSHQFAKHIEVTVSWKYKNSNQSVNVSSVLR